MSASGLSLKRLEVSGQDLRWLGQSLRVLDFFNKLPVGQLENLLPSISLWRYPAGKTVVKEGSREETLFVLYRGAAEVTRAKWLGFAQSKIAVLKPGDFFGEMAILNHSPRSATVTTTEESDIFMILERELKRLLDANPELSSLLESTAAVRKHELDG